MAQWNEMKFRNLQEKLEKCTLYGRKVTLDGGAFTIMAAYLLGVMDDLVGEADEKDLEGLDFEDMDLYL